MIDSVVGREILTRVHQTLTEADIPYWLQGGALLGLVREGNFLNHDHDIDFGVFSDIPATDIVDLLEPVGFEFSGYLAGSPDLGEHLAMFYQGIAVDFFTTTPVRDKFHCSVWSNGEMRSVLAVSSLTPELRVFGDVTVAVPSPPERYLEELYGEWRVENKKWCPNRSDALVGVTTHRPRLLRSRNAKGWV